MHYSCGIDEAGRGPTAGPVTSAAVVLPSDFPVSILADSKQLSPAKRTIAARIIMEKAIYGIGWAWPEEIDKINIHHATLLSMKRAFEEMRENLSGAIDPARDITVVVDGLYVPPLPCVSRAIVKGDTLIPEIMAASIMAKTMRDLWMIRYSWIEPAWRFDKHKGYPTREHRDLCRQLGRSPIHRKSFKIF